MQALTGSRSTACLTGWSVRGWPIVLSMRCGFFATASQQGMRLCTRPMPTSAATTAAESIASKTSLLQAPLCLLVSLAEPWNFVSAATVHDASISALTTNRRAHRYNIRLFLERGTPLSHKSDRALNKAPRRKQRGISGALQTAGFQPAFAPRVRGIQPEEIKTSLITMPKILLLASNSVRRTINPVLGA